MLELIAKPIRNESTEFYQPIAGFVFKWLRIFADAGGQNFDRRSTENTRIMHEY